MVEHYISRAISLQASYYMKVTYGHHDNDNLERNAYLLKNGATTIWLNKPEDGNSKGGCIPTTKGIQRKSKRNK
jgi:hypothetical protein